MKRLIIILVVIAIVAIAFFATGPFYVLNEGEQAVVVRLGKIVGVEKDAGLKLRSPFLDVIVKYPKQVMPWDGEPQRIPTKENQFIWVDTTARWKITDPVKFYESVSSLENAYGRLDDVIDNGVRTVISVNYLREAVRNSNNLLGTGTKESFQTGDVEGSAALEQLTQSNQSYETIDKGRRRLSEEMLAIVRPIVPQYGIEVIDIVPRQIKYSDELTESVYNRMIKERNQIAQAFRSYGEGKKAEWLGKLENEKRSILSGAYQKAETTKGKADAEATRIYSSAYSQDPSFFDFWRAIESYRQTLPSFSKTLSTDLDYFRYLSSPQGR
ncbi:MAG TPA: protease modulator HflC [Rectinemataceae bacterium]|nr:protease modulator HflC [Rectinemataceae bacterium]